MKMIRFINWTVYLFVLSLAVSACGGNDTSSGESADEATSGGQASMEDAMNEMQKQMKEMQSGEAKEVVNFRELKELLPEELNGMKKKDSSGETTGMFGMNVSHAEATYEMEGAAGKNMRVNITDVAGMGAAMMGLASWAAMDFDRETDSGYEKTTTINGNKALEKYNNQNNSGEVAMVVANRFIVTVSGNGVTADNLKDAIKDLDLNSLNSK